MKGRILGFSPSQGTGAIDGDGGQRFTFVAAQWRSEKPIVAGMAVDFAPVEGVATEIYPAVGGFGAGLGAALPAGMPAAADLAGSPVAQKLKAVFTTTLAAPLAALLLIATFLPAIGGPTDTVSLWGVDRVAKELNANPLLAGMDSKTAKAELQRIDQEKQQVETARPQGEFGMVWGESPAEKAQHLASLDKQRAQIKQSAMRANFLKLVSGLLLVRFLIPIGAAWLLWKAWASEPSRSLSMGLGAVSLLTVVLIWLYRRAIVSAGGSEEGSIGQVLSQQLDAAISLRVGFFLIAASGVALLLAGLGLIRNPLAGRAH